MQMDKDNLSICKRCGSDACYTNKVNEIFTTYWCFGCGFTSNTFMVEGHEFFKEQKEILPELYKDLLFYDGDRQIWMPSNTNIPTKGMVFLDGSTKDEWWWSAVLAVPVKEGEKKKFPIPGKKDQYYTHRVDMNTLKKFSHSDYMDALDYIGIFEQ
jgi:hypothetical protein